MKYKGALSPIKLQKGFTLIELLVVIVVIGVLAAGVLVLIDPFDKINAANDGRIEIDISAIGRSAQSYAVTHSGYYPYGLSDLVTAGELKQVPNPPTNFYQEAIQYPSGTFCTASTNSGTSNCSTFAVTGTYRSKKYTTSSPAQNVFRFEADTNKVCRPTAATAPCT